MQKDYLFFISHDSSDTDLALELYDMLLEINSDWKDQIFLDRSGLRPLEKEAEWNPAMLRAVENSRHLIFITRNLDFVKDGGGWLYREARLFHSRRVSRLKDKRPDKNVSYFGIFCCPCDFKNDLFGDEEKGSTYTDMYEEPEHVTLGEGEPLRSRMDDIRSKVLAMVAGRSDGDFSGGLLKRTKACLEKQVQQGAMLAEDAIDENLLPPLKLLSGTAEEGELSEEAKNANRLNFEGLCKLVQEKHVQLIGREGGCGKTTLMTKLFYHQLRLCEKDPANQMVPLYVDAKALAAKNTLIRRYLAHTLLDDKDAMNESDISPNVKQLDTVFSIKRTTPRYLLLIDGYNELPENSMEILDEELQDFLPGGCYESVRVVISGREVGGELPEGEFYAVHVQKLEETAVRSYLKRNVTDSLLRILSNPMYLKMYADTDIHREIRTKTDLLCAFLDWQERKDRASAAEKDYIARYHIHLRHVLPAVAYGMMTDSVGDSSFVLTKKELRSLFRQIYTRITDEDYKDYNGSGYIKCLKQSEISKGDASDFRTDFKNYAQHISKLMREDSDGNLDFTHQIYRDFFCAWYLAEDIRFGLEMEERSVVLSQKVFDDDVIEFAADLLKEGYPKYRQKTGQWDYSCNEKSCLVQLLKKLQQDAPHERISVANIVKMLRHARRKDLSGLDLSGLDLTAADLQDCTFSRFDKGANYPTNFSGARINRENLFAERHYNQLRTACTSEKYIACLDMSGFLKLWEKTMFPKFPVKVLTDLRCAATKLMFHPDGSRIYVMTAHEILEVPLPDSFISKAEPKRIFRTAYQLRDMKLDAQGQILFATHTNPFNYKNISNPEEPDRNEIYSITSSAAVSDDGSCIACGFIAGHDELKLFVRAQDGTWQEREFGFGQIMGQYIRELQELFRSMGLYEHFTKDSKGSYVGEVFFPRTRELFMDRTHHYETLPVTVAESCTSLLKSRGIHLNENQEARLNELVEQYIQRIKRALDEEGILIHLSGRRITGLSFHENSKTLLLSGTIDYGKKLRDHEDDAAKDPDDEDEGNEKKDGKKTKKDTVNSKIACSNWVVTLDKDTLATRVINMHRGENPNRAFYCGDDIVVMTRYQVNVYDENGAEVALLRPDIHRFRSFLNIPGRDTCFVFSNHNIYEMDRNLRCVRSIRNGLKETSLYYIQDAQGGEYLCRKNEKKDVFEPFGQAIHLHSGTLCPAPDDCTVLGRTGRHTDVGTMRFAIRGNSMVAFDNGVETTETAIYHSLHICGCDFRGVQGTVTEPMYLQTLYRMGGETDPVDLPQVQFITDTETFVPSEERYGLQKGLPPCTYTYREGLVLKDACEFKGKSNNRKLSEQKTWELIQSGTASGDDLDAADYSILEWVAQLRYATPDMIHDLAASGLIPQFRRKQSAQSRLTGKLHTTCKFLYRCRFFAGDVPEEPFIATVNFPFGSKVLSCITGEEPADLPSFKDNDAGTAKQGKEKSVQISNPDTLRDIHRVLALNSWFCATARRYKYKIEDYALHKIFETNLHFDGRAKVNGYLCLGGQPFFADAVRGFDGEMPEEKVFEETISKVTRLSLLALHYPTVVSLGQQLSGLGRQPILVLIGESFEQCKALDAHVRDIYPQVRKIYTFDSLLTAKKAGAGSYFEFSNGVPRYIRLESLFEQTK